MALFYIAYVFCLFFSIFNKCTYQNNALIKSDAQILDTKGQVLWLLRDSIWREKHISRAYGVPHSYGISFQHNLAKTARE